MTLKMEYSALSVRQE